MIHASAPGGVGIVGDPSDSLGGTVLCSSLPQRATASLAASDEILLDVCGERDELSPGADLTLKGGATDIARAVLRTFPDTVGDRGFHLTASMALPGQAAPAGSIALLTAILGAVLRWLEISLNRYEIAELAHRIALEGIGPGCGYQHAYLAAFGGLPAIDFRDKDPAAPADDPVFATIEPLQELAPLPPLVVASTGSPPAGASFSARLAERWVAGEQEVIEGCARLARLSREAKKALLAGDWDCLGAAMNENQALQRALGDRDAASEALVAAALDAGALGARLTDTQGPHTVVALHPDPRTLITTLEAAGGLHVTRVTPGEGLVVEAEY